MSCQADPSVYHIDDSLANVKLLYLPSGDLSFIPRANLPSRRDNKSASILSCLRTPPAYNYCLSEIRPRRDAGGNLHN